jgi:hypothetical protein
MARANLASLLAATDSAKAEAFPVPESAAKESGETRGAQGAPLGRKSPSIAQARTDKDAAAYAGDAGQQHPEAGPRYLQLERKELRIRVDQADELARLTRRINRARRGAGERITDNTLIRVAIDLLLERTVQLEGTTEDELRKSLTL